MANRENLCQGVWNASVIIGHFAAVSSTIVFACLRESPVAWICDLHPQRSRCCPPLNCTTTCLTSPPLWPLCTGQVCVCVCMFTLCVCLCVVCVQLVHCWTDGETWRRRRRGDFNPQLSTPKVRLRGWKENLARPLCVLSGLVYVCRALASVEVLGSAIQNEWV